MCLYCAIRYASVSLCHVIRYNGAGPGEREEEDAKTEALRVLLQHGANRGLRTREGLTPALMALSLEVIRTLTLTRTLTLILTLPLTLILTLTLTLILTLTLTLT